MTHSFFSLGSIVSRLCPALELPWPWTISAALLGAGSLWDKLANGGPVDFILLGLAGYELVIGLTEETPRPVLA